MLLFKHGNTSCKYTSYPIISKKKKPVFIGPKSIAYRESGRRQTTISLEECGILKQRYGLSIQAWIRRAAELEIISD